MLSRRFILANRLVGVPKLTDFKLDEETLSTDLKEGEILARCEYATVDPYMRAFAFDAVRDNETLPCGQVARIIKSRCSEYPEGMQVIGYFGWRDVTIYKPEPQIPRSWLTIQNMPDMKGLPDSYALGCMGMPGNTAYFGLLEICDPKPGETLVVSAAAGAVGSLVGQIGKIKGCKVIGFAGSDDKLKWMKEELGFDHVFNYKNIDLDKTFREYAPNGIDCYFDNVGGEFVYHVVNHMNQFGRITQCGSISTYNTVPEKGYIYEPFNHKVFRVKKIKLEGFNVSRWANRWFEGINQMRDWILEGKLKIRETVVEKFEAMPRAFIELLEGKNTGKMIIKMV